MKKTICISVFSLAFLFFLSKHFLKYSPAFINIANDILAMPVFLIILETSMKFLYGSRFKMSLGYIAATFITISVLFEGILPMKYPNMKADPLDVFWYFTGTILFIVLFSTNLIKRAYL